MPYSKKNLFLLFLSLITALCFMFNCSSPSPGEGTGANTDPTDSDEGGGDGTTTSQIECALPKCSGSKCCNKVDKEEKEECENWCGGREYLDLSGEGYKICLALERKFVKEKLVVLFGDDVLGDPDEEKLIKKMDKEDINVICSAVRELDIDLLENLIDDYVPYQAEVFLNWVGVNKLAIEIFKNTKDTGDGIDLFKKLLEKVGGSSGTQWQKILNALKAKNQFEEDDEEHILERALNQNNKELVRFIHNNIVRDREDGICGEDNKRYHPTPDSGSYLNNEEGFESAKKRSKYACILGVYCFVDDTEEGNRFRKNLAQLLKESGVGSLIRSPTTKGGMGLTNSAPQNEWSHPVCKELRITWNNGAVDMGLNRF